MSNEQITQPWPPPVSPEAAAAAAAAAATAKQKKINHRAMIGVAIGGLVLVGGAIVHSNTTEATTGGASVAWRAWASSHTDEMNHISTLEEDAASKIKAMDLSGAAAAADEVASDFDGLASSVPTETAAGQASYHAFNVCAAAYHHSSRALQNRDLNDIDSVSADLNQCNASLSTATSLFN